MVHFRPTKTTRELQFHAADNVKLLKCDPKMCLGASQKWRLQTSDGQKRGDAGVNACRDRDGVSFRCARTFRIPVDGALVVGVAAVLFGGFVYGDGAALRVGVEQEERLEVISDAFADHVFPPGANLQETDDGQQGLFWQPESLLGLRCSTGVCRVSIAQRRKQFTES